MYELDDIEEIEELRWVKDIIFCTHVRFKDGMEWCSHCNWSITDNSDR